VGPRAIGFRAGARLSQISSPDRQGLGLPFLLTTLLIGLGVLLVPGVSTQLAGYLALPAQPG